MNPANAAAVIMKKRREIIRKFREAGATSPTNAKSLEEIGLSRTPVLNLQKSRGVVVEPESGLYYLNEAREEETVRLRRTLLIAVLVLAALLVWLASRA